MAKFQVRYVLRQHDSIVVETVLLPRVGAVIKQALHHFRRHRAIDASHDQRCNARATTELASTTVDALRNKCNDLFDIRLGLGRVFFKRATTKRKTAPTQELDTRAMVSLAQVAGRTGRRTKRTCDTWSSKRAFAEIDPCTPRRGLVAFRTDTC
jgi:hypothetical protein